ncbi:MAG: hypothetical protein IPI17_12475 [Nitrosomonas sp.]|nr:hypothetical protein [Nitrosomonas sp.]
MTNSTSQDYSAHVTAKSVTRGRSLDDRGEEPQTLCNAAFLLSGVALYGRAGQGAARLAGAIPVFEPVQFRPPRFEAWKAVRSTNWRSHIMSKNPQGVQAPVVFSFNSLSIRAVTDEHGNPWFVASDACKILGYKNVNRPGISGDKFS